MVARYSFDTLPLHPPPEPWEALSSYVARLAYTNRIPIKKLWELCYAGQSLQACADQLEATCLPLDSLALLTATSPACLRPTTGYHLQAKFGLTSPTFKPHGFFHNSISPNLRFCSLCIAELPYYMLLWRFSALNGCVHHRCRLVPRCPACQQSLPLTAPEIATLHCPTCNFDLRRCAPTTLTDEQLEYTALLTRDLEFLLSPHQDENDPTSCLQRIGTHLVLQRQRAAMSYADITPLLQIPDWALRVMESGHSGSGHASFAMYLHYMYYLGLNFTDLMLFTLDKHHTSSHTPVRPTPCIHVAGYHQILLRHPALPSEQITDHDQESIVDPFLARVAEALTTLTTTGEPLLWSTLSRMIGVPRELLVSNAGVRRLFSKHVAHRRAFQRRYGRWVIHIALQDAIHDFLEQQHSLALRFICTRTRLTPETVTYYPETTVLLEELTKIPQRWCMVERYEQTLTQRVATILAENTLITWMLLARRVGVAPARLKQYGGIQRICRQLSEHSIEKIEE